MAVLLGTTLAKPNMRRLPGVGLQRRHRKLLLFEHMMRPLRLLHLRWRCRRVRSRRVRVRASTSQRCSRRWLHMVAEVRILLVVAGIALALHEVEGAGTVGARGVLRDGAWRRRLACGGCALHNRRDMLASAGGQALRGCIPRCHAH